MSKTNDFQPWNTTVREGVIPDDLLEAMLTEALMRPSGDPKMTVDLANAIDEDSLPVIHRFVNQTLLPEALRYVKDIYGVVPNHIDHKSWIRMTVDGSGLLIHEHTNSHVTCIVYLEGDDGDLVLQDPRQNAGRSYPTSIRKGHFKPMVIKPKAGRFLIFPAYLHHYVDRHNPSLRCVVTMDLFVKDKPDDN